MKATIVHPTKGQLRFKPYDFQQEFLYDRSPRRLVLKARQIGFSQVFALEAIHGALHRENDTTLIISRNQDAAEQIIGYCYNALNSLADVPRLSKANQSEIEFPWGSSIVALAATRAAGRSRTARRVYLDEWAYAPYAADIFQAVSPIVAHGGQLTVCSTPWGRSNHFFRLWSGQEGGEWKRHRYDWRECPSYDQAWYERERPNYTAQQWASEYECDFATSGLAVFNPADLERATDGWKGFQTWQQGRRYVTGVDVGRRQDATVIITLDVTELPYQVVAFERHLSLPYPAIQARIDARCADYGGVVFVESNGPGDPVIENLTYIVNPFVTTQKSKFQAITALSLLHENGHVRYNIPEIRREMDVYQLDDRELVQDTVMAFAIAAFHAETRPTDHAIVDEFPRVQIGAQVGW